ncbi:hypothetical protein DO72_5629 [Burkholderia pseudomallei]|nr:hypothetical protein DO72_5629 [Burkholderia pseudomallei]
MSWTCIRCEFDVVWMRAWPGAPCLDGGCPYVFRQALSAALGW